MELLINAIIISASIVWLTTFCTPYINFLKYFNIYKKPLNCAGCLSFYTATIAIFFMNLTFIHIFFPPFCALLAIVFERAVKSLPLIF